MLQYGIQRNKISLSFLFAAIILTVVAVTIYYTIVRDSLERVIHAHLCTTVQSRTDHIETFLEEHKQTVEFLSEGIIFKEFLK